MPNNLTIGSLFSGIGGLELGLERAGLGPVIWQAECDPYCLKVLTKHWPQAERFTDVKQIDETTPRPDIICGGFPCQDISYAGKGAGINGSRSGLWSEYVRIIRALRSRFVVVENVPALLNRGMGRVLGDLAESGYDAQWDCVSASAVGAPHRRHRVFIVAHTMRKRRGTNRIQRKAENKTGTPRGSIDSSSYQEMANTKSTGLERRWERLPSKCRWWTTEPDVGRVADGVPNRIHRLKGLGNAVVPQVAEYIGKQIIEHAKRQKIAMTTAHD
jgi:DNA (cytosine-5)-methyltransferase 1